MKIAQMSKHGQKLYCYLYIMMQIKDYMYGCIIYFPKHLGQFVIFKFT